MNNTQGNVDDRVVVNWKRDELIKLLGLFYETRAINTQNIRDTIKFCQALILALLGAASVTMQLLGPTNIFTFIFPILAITFSVIGFQDAKRNYIRYLNWAIMCCSVQSLLGLNDEIKTEDKKEGFILPSYFRTEYQGKLENLKKAFERRFSHKILLEETVFRTAGWIFITFIVISGIFLLFQIFFLGAIWLQLILGSLVVISGLTLMVVSLSRSMKSSKGLR